MSFYSSLIKWFSKPSETVKSSGFNITIPIIDFWFDPELRHYTDKDHYYSDFKSYFIIQNVNIFY